MNIKRKRSLLVCFGVVFLLITGCCPFADKNPSCGSPKKYLPIVSHLLEQCDLPEVETPEELVEETKHLFLTREQRMAADFDPLPIKDDHAFYNDLSLLRMTQVVPAYAATYGSAVVFGGTLATIRQRLDFLVREWHRGVRFKKIIFLSGRRERYAKVEDSDQFYDNRHNPFPVEENWNPAEHKLPSSEDEIARFVWTQMVVPSSWRDLSGGMEVEFLVAEPAEGQKYGTRHDTLKVLRAYHGDGSERILFVSSQPFIHLDRSRAAKHFEKEKYDVAGPGFSQAILKHDWAPRVCLHSLAAWASETDGHLVISQE
ncbi:hypothetical protein [Chlamydia psittaci]|uniref:hypothetical protein n=1 Tax=Chlamydia psittaci TaxID=83554 RepID=UPI00086A95F0|nr:hypothetical protein [Chlamydia psittaci]OEH43984.1 hypothetical protein A9968_03240 [Chlamydia psittaci]OEH45006.1 hypothetical protein A9969_03250 [Chlamydia psittaci]